MATRMHPERKHWRKLARKSGLSAAKFIAGAIAVQNENFSPCVWESHVEWAIRDARHAARCWQRLQEFPLYAETER